MTLNLVLSFSRKVQKQTHPSEKDAEAGPSKKAKAQKGNNPMANLNVEERKAYGYAHRSLGVHLANRKRSLAKSSDSESESEGNFKHGGHKKRETVLPRDIRVNLEDDLFYDIQSCSGEPANLEDVFSLPLPLTAIFFSFSLISLIFAKHGLIPYLFSVNFPFFQIGELDLA